MAQEEDLAEIARYTREIRNTGDIQKFAQRIYSSHLNTTEVPNYYPLIERLIYTQADIEDIHNELLYSDFPQTKLKRVKKSLQTILKVKLDKTVKDNLKQCITDIEKISTHSYTEDEIQRMKEIQTILTQIHIILQTTHEALLHLENEGKVQIIRDPEEDYSVDSQFADT